MSDVRIYELRCVSCQQCIGMTQRDAPPRVWCVSLACGSWLAPTKKFEERDDYIFFAHKRGETVISLAQQYKMTTARIYQIVNSR